MKSPSINAYGAVISGVFRKRWRRGLQDVPFTKDDLIAEADSLGIKVKNVADILYTFRSRREMPAELLEKGNWVIESRGPGKYSFVHFTGSKTILIDPHLKVYPIPYAVPEIVAANLATDEQGLLTVVRYNRVLDVFTGIACFHLQSHVRTQIAGHGQVEVDDLYVGVNKDGEGFVLPVEGKDAGEPLGVDKAVSLTLFAKAKHPKLRCRPIAVIREAENQITCVEFEPAESLPRVSVLDIRRYRLIREE